MKFEIKLWMKIHNYVSAFFLPLAMIFIITGMLYLLGVHGTMKQQKIDFQVESSLMQNPDALTEAVKTKLEENNIKMPVGNAKKMREGYIWGSMTDVSVSLFPDRQSGTFQIAVNTAGLYDKLVMAHKGKIGLLFNIFSILFSISLLITYFSGVFLAVKNSKSRKNIVIVISIGLITAVVLLIASV